MDIKNLVWSYKNNIIDDIKTLVRIPSIEAPEKDNMPFGEECAKALNAALKLGENLGFKTKNLDNYCGYIEYGEGDEIMGILSHVDVVPPGEGWSNDPFTPILKNDKLYGRGTADDKGPFVASLYSLKVIKDMGILPKKRIRLIVGANEETGSKCVEHYKEVEGDIALGFSPDASFPLIFGEKGIIRAKYVFENSNEGEITLENISGGEAANVVCPKVNATLLVPEKKIPSFVDAYTAYLEEKGLSGEAVKDRDAVHLTLFGVNAHASTPEEGVNAISYMTDFLSAHIKNTFIDYVAKHFGTVWDLGMHSLAVHDEYGSATCNLGVVKTQKDKITLIIDIRYPITVDFTQSIHSLEKAAKENGVLFTLETNSPPLFVDPQSDLVKALYKAYVTVTGDTEHKPITIGGGTYSRSFSNTVAFGAEMPKGPYMAHMADEYISIEDLLISCQAFVEAIRNLLLV